MTNSSDKLGLTLVMGLKLIPVVSRAILENGRIGVGIHMIVSDIIFMMYFGYLSYSCAFYQHWSLGNRQITHELELYLNAYVNRGDIQKIKTELISER